jgi:hypothetical protein
MEVDVTLTDLSRPTRLPGNWGGAPDEVARDYPADGYLAGMPGLRAEALTRAVTVRAPAELTYRWLCQIALAPYSYDWLDNLGRRSPRELTPGAGELTVGQRMMIFDLVEFEPGRSWSGRGLPGPERLFGPIAVTYAAEPVGPAGPDEPGRCRLVCRLVAGWTGPLGAARERLLAWGDLIMMRKQLLTLRALAERDAG